MNGIKLESTIAIKSDTSLTTNMDGEVVILDTANGKYFGLDGVGARVWQIIESPKRVDEIKAVILDEYDVEADRCEQDLITLISSLYDAELVIVT